MEIVFGVLTVNNSVLTATTLLQLLVHAAPHPRISFMGAMGLCQNILCGVFVDWKVLSGCFGKDTID